MTAHDSRRVLCGADPGRRLRTTVLALSLWTVVWTFRMHMAYDWHSPAASSSSTLQPEAPTLLDTTDSFRRSQPWRYPTQSSRNRSFETVQTLTADRNVIRRSSATRPFVSACLLTKDDVAILPEWIAYHYHMLRIRHIVVAVDPTSTQSPSAVLQRFRRHLPDLVIEEWADAYFMPDAFLALPPLSTVNRTVHNNDHDAAPTDDESHVVPNFVPKRFQNASSSPWHFGNESAAQLSVETKIVNRHRYRQRVFLHKCYRHFHELKNSETQTRRRWLDQNNRPDSNWVVHVDTDEYVVLNPFVRQQPGRLSSIPRLPIDTIEPDCIFQMLEDMFQYYPKRVQRACLSMPTILYGSVEEQYNRTSAGPFDSPFSRLETIRWKYHGDWDDPINGFDKVMIDLSATQVQNDVVLQGPYVYNPHQPSSRLCPKLRTVPEIAATRKYPLTVNHYLGTWQRFSARGDSRKSWPMYERKANLSSVHDDDQWINGWLSSFVDVHGIDTAKLLLFSE